MRQHELRMNFDATLPYNSAAGNNALPVSAENLSQLTDDDVSIVRGFVSFSGSMYQDDIVSVFAKSFATRPGASQPGHPDYDTYVMMRALIFTFENAAWVKHGYSGDNDLQRSRSLLTEGMKSMPSAQEVSEVYARVVESLNTRRN